MKKELSYLETIKIVDEIKKFLESQLEARLTLTKVQSPLFIKLEDYLQNSLNISGKAISFYKGNETFEIINSLTNWKRDTLKKYEFPMHTGLYTEMRVIRKDEIIDEIHSILVEQWSFEKVICKEDGTLDYLKDTVRSIYKSIRQTSIFVKQKYHFITVDLPKTITFITSQELEELYPDKSLKEREDIITREKKAISIIGTKDKLKSCLEKDLKRTSNDELLKGYMLVYNKTIDKVMELTSIRIKKAEKLSHQQKYELPYTIGGGIGQSRVLMLLLEKYHIAEVQASSWDNKTLKILQDKKVL